jgi:exosortase
MPSLGSIVTGLKIATIVLVISALFYQDLTILVSDALQSDFMSYILVIPFLFVYLLYRKRKMLRAAIAEKGDAQGAAKYLPGMIGVLLSATAILVYWHGSYTFTPLDYHMIALPMLAAGLILVFFNPQTLRQSIFAVAFLIFLTPPPLEILYSWGSTLSVVSSQASFDLIRLFRVPSSLTSEYGTPVIYVATVSGQQMRFAVDVACSGIYSLVGFLVFAVFVAYLIRDQPWKKLVLFLAGFLLIYAINITRISTILMIGYEFGQTMALDIFHLLGEWVMIFIGTLVLLIGGEKILHAQIFTTAQKCSECKPKREKMMNFCPSCGKLLRTAQAPLRRVDAVKIVAVLSVMILLLSIQVPVFALTQGPAQVLVDTPMGEQGNTQLLPSVLGYKAVFLYRDVAFQNLSGQDASLIYAYQSAGQNNTPIYVALEIASTTGPLHRWEYCLVGPDRPAYATELALTDIQILDNPPIIARYFAFNLTSTNQTQVVLYWYESAVFLTNGTSQLKQVEISLITLPPNPKKLTPIQDLQPFATAIAQYWEPIKTWTQVALLLSQQSLYLAALTGVPIPFIVTLYASKRRSEKRANSNAYLKLPEPMKSVVDTVLETEKKGNPTLKAISAAYQNRTGQPVGEESMLAKLEEVERLGIVKREISNVQDQPTRVWRAQTASAPLKKLWSPKQAPILKRKKREDN